METKSKSLSSRHSNNIPTFPFVLCHLDESNTCGQERYEIIESLLREEKGNSDVDFFLDEIPIYNHIFSKDENEKEQEKEKDEEKENTDKLNGACFYSSMTSSVARRISSHNTIYATPLSSSLKTRKSSFLNNLNEKDNSEIQIPRAVSIYTSPSVFLSHHKAEQMLTKFSDKSKTTCSNDFNTAFFVSASSIDKSHFFFEIQDEKQDRVTHECLKLFIDYLTEKSDIISVDLVMKTFLLNEIASWIIQGSPEVNTLPWYDLGLDGSGEIVQVSDSGLDESHCYLKDKNGVVPLTEDFDLTGKIDNSKRKVIQYVALTGIGDRTDHSHHGSHVVGTILGKRSDDGVNEVTGLVDGIAPASKVTFFDANSDPENDMTFLIPLDISQMFYFGKQAQVFAHSASWGSNSDGGQYSSRVREVDQYFYDSEDDDFIMFLAAGNDGSTNGAKIDDPSASKNVISVGASHSYGKNLYGNMKGFDYVASFSSRGPTADNRIKPDIIAPGHSVLSIKAGSNGECDPDYRPQYMGPGNKDHAGLTFKSGTSMSCPVAVGTGALVRQYFLEIHSPSMDISGTLLKAVLINGAEALVGRSTSTYGSESEPSTLYDKFQGYGRLNLLKSLKHPYLNLNSPDVHVEDAKVLQQGQSHEYEFNVCDTHDFRVTVVWQDPPGQVGCAKCLVNDLDVEVLYDGQTHHPNGKENRDSRNNVERVILSRDDFSSSDSNSVIVRVEARNIGFGKTQKYSLASTGCIDTVDFISTTPSPTTSCGENQFQYLLEISTDRKPEETSWSLAYQDNGGVIDVRRAGHYDKKLRVYREQSCVNFGCFVFIIKDAEYNGLCCEKGMGFYQISAEGNVLLQSDSFSDRQEINKFCYYKDEDDDDYVKIEEPTSSPTFSCDEDEVEYTLDITTDLHPDETRWKLRYSKIDGVDPEYYKEEYTVYNHEGGCLDYGCYEFTFYGKGKRKIFVEDDVFVGEWGIYWLENLPRKKEFCYGPSYSYNPSLQPSKTQNPSTRPSENSSSSQSPSQKPLQPPTFFPSQFGVDLYEAEDPSNILGDSKVNHDNNGHTGSGYVNMGGQGSWIEWPAVDGGNGGTCTLKFRYALTNPSTTHTRPCQILVNDVGVGTVAFPRVGGSWSDYSIDSLDILCPEGSFKVRLVATSSNGGPNLDSLEVVGSETYSPTNSFFPSEPPTYLPTQSPTYSNSPTSVCGENEYLYEIVIVTDGNPHETDWTFYDTNNIYSTIIDSVDEGYYTEPYTTYVHKYCLGLGCYTFAVFDRYGFYSGGYKVKVGNYILAEGRHFDDWKEYTEFCYSGETASPSYSQAPSAQPSERLVCDEGQFWYKIQIITYEYTPISLLRLHKFSPSPHGILKFFKI